MEVFGVLDLNNEKLEKEMNELEEIAANGGQIDTDWVKLLSTQLWQQLKYKESLLAQKSRTKWIAEGDVNTRYFHMCMNNNRRRNQIVKLRSGYEWVEEAAGIKLPTKIYFEDRFREENICRPVLDGVSFRSISEANNDFLTAPISVEEVKEVVWECDDNKSPGPDGFNLNFYKSCWDLVAKDVMGFMIEFLATGTVPKAICASFLALIPKTSNPQDLNDYRPISLIGSLYKILAKTLAGRLKRVLENVI